MTRIAVPGCGRTGVKHAARAISWGFDMTTVGGDSRVLAAARRAY
jgi:hypothetical protein